MLALIVPAIALYCVASWRLGAGVRGDVEPGTLHNRIGLLLGMIAISLHLGIHASEILRTGGIPLHFFSALSWVALGMAALSTAVAWNRAFDALGSLVYPLAALCLLGLAVRPAGPAGDGLSWPLRAHALTALLAYATLAFAALLALLLAMQERLLRQRALDHPLLRLLPPLTELESLLFRTISAGFLLLTLALALGTVFVENLFAQHLIHKTVLSALSWAVFGALLIGRWRYGWRGRRAVRLTLAAMALLLLAFFGSKFVLELVLGRST